MNNKKAYKSTLHGYLRPEAFCAEMIQNGFPFDLVKIISDSNFKKSYRNEIENVQFTYNELLREEEMELLLNRDGIYDRLPEGIFHQTKGNSKTLTTAQMTEEYRRFREEEKMARKFFQPIEQEVFRYSTLVQQEELNLAFDMLKGNRQGELFKFWELDEGLPVTCAQKLVQLMPWASYIKGNRELTARALSIIIEQPVDAEEWIETKQFAPEAGLRIGAGKLGIDTVTGNQYQEPVACWKFCIKELQKSQIEQYRPGNPHGKFLRQFEEIFIPLPIDIIFEYELFSTDDRETEDILGYSLVL